MGRLLFVALLVVVTRSVHSTYLALAPSVFHPGWKYAIQLTIHGVTIPGHRVTVTANIFNPKKQSLGANSVTLDDGQSDILEIQVGASIEHNPNDVYHLQLDGSGGLTFSNTTTLKLAPLTYLTYIQTDKKIYKAGQLVRFRVLALNKDLVPMRVPKNITIQNPSHSTLARFYCLGKKAVYENTYQLTDFPELGNWKIVVQSAAGNIHDEVPFVVDEYVLPKFDVSLKVTPEKLIKGQGQHRVTVGITAKYTYGKGVRGDVRLTVVESQNVHTAQITDSSGKKDMELDLSTELDRNHNYDGLSFVVEVTDETKRTYTARATVEIVEELVKFQFCPICTDLVFRPGMPFQAVVKFTDVEGQPLPEEYLEGTVVISLKDPNNAANNVDRVFNLAAGQKDARLNIDQINVNVDTNYLELEATMQVPRGKVYTATETVNRFNTVATATLNLRWVEMSSRLSMGSNASFVVDFPTNVNFTSITYMIISRGSVQAFGNVIQRQTNSIKVTTDMCPMGRLIVYGITARQYTEEVPEVIADSLNLRLDHCLDKKVTPSVAVNTQRTGTQAEINVEVAWADPWKQNEVSVGRHDVFLLAVDKSLILLQGDNDLNRERVVDGLAKFHLPPVDIPWTGEGGVGLLPRQPMTSKNAPTSTGSLLRDTGMVIVTDMKYALSRHAAPLEKDVDGGDGSVVSVADSLSGTVRRYFPDTWLWKTAQTDPRGRLSLVETLPDSITSWVISAFAVRNDTELAVTGQTFELNAFNSFFVTLNLPYSIRRTEKFELRATVFNYETINVDATVILAPSEDYTIAGPTTESTFVRSGSASSVTFIIVASKVGTIELKVTASAQRSNGATITDEVRRRLVVKPEGVLRMRSVTFPAVLSVEEPVYDQNVTIDSSPWSARDVIKDSRRVTVKVTGDAMGNSLSDTNKLIKMPTGCGEQNMITTVPNIYGMAYLTAVNGLKMSFETQAKENMKNGYIRETQQYKWDNGGFSAFGTKDKTASTWLTAFVLKSFAQARRYIPDTVDVDILNQAVDFLFTRHNNASGFFFEQGDVLHEEMQGGTGSGDALSAFVTTCLLEARKYNVMVNNSRLNAATNYVRGLSDGSRMMDRPFLAASTAYALALQHPTSPDTHDRVKRLIGYIVSKGAPWRKEPTGPRPQAQERTNYYRHPPGPSDIEVTALCVLAYNTIAKPTEARELVFWLQRQQNAEGGFRSTQDTVLALQAISEYSANFAGTNPTADVAIKVLYPKHSTRTVNIDPANAAILQVVELPDDTRKVNIRVTGKANSLAVVKVVWHFHTAPDMRERHEETGQYIRVNTETNQVRPGFHKVKACMEPSPALRYNRMMLLTLDLPSGFAAENVLNARQNNPNVVRLEQDNDRLHLYMRQPQRDCVNVVIEETAVVQNRKNGIAHLIAYYSPDIRSEAAIRVQCPNGVCRCAGDNCNLNAADGPLLSRLLLINCVGFLFALFLSV